jgi:hypothetical protein
MRCPDCGETGCDGGCRKPGGKHYVPPHPRDIIWGALAGIPVEGRIVDRIETMLSDELRPLKILLGRCLPFVADYTDDEAIEIGNAIMRVLHGPDSPLVPPGTIAALPSESVEQEKKP